MLTRSLLTSALPTARRRSLLTALNLRLLVRRLRASRTRSLQVQDRVDATRARCVNRHLYGRRDA
ncbi:MAG TPA: hypothetical protein VHV75_11690 [Solirubrobacteraceae bacterium]|jgi:hypothetical protein|nr:hypothetical protein [Solirubrobacteraceae bacterium]